MFSSRIPKKEIYFRILSPQQKKKSDSSFNLIYFNNRINNPINSIRTKSNNNQSINLSTIIHKRTKIKKYEIITPSRKKKNIKINPHKISNKFTIESNLDSNQNNEKIYLKPLSPRIMLNKSMRNSQLYKNMDFDPFFNCNNNSILWQINSTKRPKLDLNEYKKIDKENRTVSLKTVKFDYMGQYFINQSEKDIKINNTHNNSNIYDKTNIENLNISKYNVIKSYTEKRTKNYNFIEKNQKTELFRNFEDLEKKSLEISRRRPQKNFSNKNFFNFKKNNDLREIKLSLEAIKTKNIFKQHKNKKKMNKIININNNSSINNIKKLFIVKSNNKNKIKEKNRLNHSPYINKKYIEDNIPENVLKLSIHNTNKNENASFHNKRKKLIRNILPSISEEDDKIKYNINNLVNILEKIIYNKNKIKKQFINEIKEEKGKNKIINNIYNNTKYSSDFKYTKKIIPRNINKNNKFYEKKDINKFNILNEANGNKNKF